MTKAIKWNKCIGELRILVLTATTTGTSHCKLPTIVKLFYKIHLLEGRSVELILFFVLVCEHLCSQSQAQSKGNKLNLIIPLTLASPF